MRSHSNVIWLSLGNRIIYCLEHWNTRFFKSSRFRDTRPSQKGLLLFGKSLRTLKLIARMGSHYACMPAQPYSKRLNWVHLTCRYAAV